MRPTISWSCCGLPILCCKGTAPQNSIFPATLLGKVSNLLHRENILQFGAAALHVPPPFWQPLGCQFPHSQEYPCPTFPKQTAVQVILPLWVPKMIGKCCGGGLPGPTGLLLAGESDQSLIAIWPQPFPALFSDPVFLHCKGPAPGPTRRGAFFHLHRGFIFSASPG